MPTPICNCPADIGWLPDAAWPYGGCSGQPIYCRGGDPVVPPRGLFQGNPSPNEARVDFALGGGAFPFLAGGTPAVPTPITPANGYPSVTTNATITNNSCYPMQLVYHGTLAIHTLLQNPALIGVGFNVVTSGGIVDNVTDFAFIYGSDTQGAAGIGANYREQNFLWMPAALLAPGAAATITPTANYYFNIGGPTAFNGILGLTSALRVFGGNP